MSCDYHMIIIPSLTRSRPVNHQDGNGHHTQDASDLPAKKVTITCTILKVLYIHVYMCMYP